MIRSMRLVVWLGALAFFAYLSSSTKELKRSLDLRGKIRKAKLTMPDAQPWNDIDWSTDRVSCGTWKCFFPSASNATTGYLLAHKKTYGTIEKTFQLERELQADFGIDICGLEHPHQIKLTKPQIKVLKSYTYQPRRAFVGKRQFSPYRKKKTITVQQVKRIPEPNVFVATMNDNFRLSKNGLDNFRPLIDDRQAFRTKFREEIQTSVAMVNKHSGLLYDFQVLVDTTGAFHHLDLDRIWEKLPKNYVPVGLSELQNRLTTILDLLVPPAPTEEASG